MVHQPKSIRTFIGAKDYAISKQFYIDLGFEAIDIDPKMTYFKVDEQMGFYLQDYYVKDWVDNSMILLEVDDVVHYSEELLQLELHKKYEGVRFSKIKNHEWGRVLFMHDPAGVLWHFCEFYNL